MKPTGLVFFPAFDWAISPTHPEREERLLYTRDQIFEEGIMDLPRITEYQPEMATDKDIARTHFCVPTVGDQATECPPHIMRRSFDGSECPDARGYQERFRPGQTSRTPLDAGLPWKPGLL